MAPEIRERCRFGRQMSHGRRKHALEKTVFNLLLNTKQFADNLSSTSFIFCTPAKIMLKDISGLRAQIKSELQ